MSDGRFFVFFCCRHAAATRGRRVVFGVRVFSGKRGHGDLGEGEWKGSGGGFLLCARQRPFMQKRQIYTRQHATFHGVEDPCVRFLFFFFLGQGHPLYTPWTTLTYICSVCLPKTTTKKSKKNQKKQNKINLQKRRLSLLFAASCKNTRLKLAAKTDASLQLTRDWKRYKNKVAIRKPPPPPPRMPS